MEHPQGHGHLDAHGGTAGLHGMLAWLSDDSHSERGMGYHAKQSISIRLGFTLRGHVI
jgi:hypothetical protein